MHPHEQATKAGPKIIEFTLPIEEKKVVIDAEGTTFQAMTFNGSMSGRLMVCMRATTSRCSAARQSLTLFGFSETYLFHDLPRCKQLI